jgi:hypothetical protein
MATLNQAVSIIEELSAENKINLLSILLNKYKNSIEQELLDEYNNTKFLYDTCVIEPQTVNEVFERLSI